MYSLSDYDFTLPEAQIAQHPAERRDGSRMLQLDRSNATWTDSHFADLPQHLRTGDVLVLNNTRVFPARLVGKRPTGGHAELLLIRPTDDEHTWLALAKPGRKLQPGATATFGNDDELQAEIVDIAEEGRRVVKFTADAPLHDVIDRVGRMPLPPYIKRPTPQTADRERYQTVYAEHRGSIAAPTAGLHFTPVMLETLRGMGVHIAEVTLHVGYGTFEPVRVDDLRTHQVAAERYTISPTAADTINTARAAGGRVIAVGTTSTRTLETAATEGGVIQPGHGETSLTITPGYRFRALDGLLTNFHLPQSSLLVLVSTFGGHDFVLKAYRHAVEAGYRFYSYGDCMLLL
ncbi:MAG: tRNA preQ1(34) S-adenosylmethionine ribosyltransferase-isomerase QueA [Rhodothermales bacterium]